MADKIVVDDVSKLRPELLKLSDAEFERQRTEFEMAAIRRAEIKAEAARSAALDA